MRIFLTGAAGFIGRNLLVHLKKSDKNIICSPSSKELDLTNKDSVNKWFYDHGPFDYIIHTAIKIGNRNSANTLSDFIDNIQMYKNLIKFNLNHGILINFCSGAAFDRNYDIKNAPEESVIDRNPSDYYGLSKNLIAKDIHLNKDYKIFNLRLFGCFGADEPDGRLIKTSIQNFNSGIPVKIYQNKEMDFFYIKDVILIVDYIMHEERKTIIPRDINLCYDKKINLVDIVKRIAYHMDSGEIILQNKDIGHSYTGLSERLSKLQLKLTGLWAGIIEVIKNDSR